MIIYKYYFVTYFFALFDTMIVRKNTYASAVFSSVHKKKELSKVATFFILDYLLSCETPKQCVTIIDMPGHMDFTWGDCGVLIISAGKQFKVLEYRSNFFAYFVVTNFV